MRVLVEVGLGSRSWDGKDCTGCENGLDFRRSVYIGSITFTQRIASFTIRSLDLVFTTRLTTGTLVHNLDVIKIVNWYETAAPERVKFILGGRLTRDG